MSDDYLSRLVAERNGGMPRWRLTRAPERAGSYPQGVHYSTAFHLVTRYNEGADSSAPEPVLETPIRGPKAVSSTSTEPKELVAL